MLPPRLDGQIDLLQTARIGIELCRDEKWARGLDYLTAVANADISSDSLPPTFHSYLGLATAIVQKRYGLGVRLCEVAVKRALCEPENHYNLVRAYLLVGNMGAAWRALSAGRGLAPEHAGLKELQRQEFPRQRPALPFLQRANPLNVLLGKIRHGMREGSLDLF